MQGNKGVEQFDNFLVFLTPEMEHLTLNFIQWVQVCVVKIDNCVQSINGLVKCVKQKKARAVFRIIVHLKQLTRMVFLIEFGQQVKSWLKEPRYKKKKDERLVDSVQQDTTAS